MHLTTFWDAKIAVRAGRRLPTLRHWAPQQQAQEQEEYQDE